MACKTALRPGLAWAGGLAGWQAGLCLLYQSAIRNLIIVELAPFGSACFCFHLPVLAPRLLASRPVYPTFCTQSCITALVAAKQADVCG
jgi:hypothetical protein